MPSVTVAFACTSVIARALAPADATAGDTRLLAMVFAVIEDTEALHRKKGKVHCVAFWADKQSVYGYQNRLW